MNSGCRKVLFLICLFIPLVGCQPDEFRVGEKETINQDLVEPSGIVFHAERGTLFIVGDEGTVAEMSLAGETLQKSLILGADLEGITYNPNTGLLYAVVEGDNTILEITTNDLEVRRSFPIKRDFQGTTLLQPGNNGIEAITFIADRQHQEGGLFYITNQTVDPAGEVGSGLIIQVEVPLQGSAGDSATATITDVYMLQGHGDLSGMHYDDRSDSFFVISDSLNEVLKVTRAGGIESIVHLPGEDQEGIAFDQEGYMYIAQDSGTIEKFMTHGKR